MADLYEFPYFEEEDRSSKAAADRNPDEFMKVAEISFGFDVEAVRALGEITHTFTRYKARLFPVILRTAAPVSVPGYIWVDRQRLKELPFSAGHRKIVDQLYRAQEGFVNFGSASHSKIDSNEEDHSQIGKADEKDRFCKGAASQNSRNLTERGT